LSTTARRGDVKRSPITKPRPYHEWRQWGEFDVGGCCQKSDCMCHHM